MLVVGTIDIVRSSDPEPEGVSYVVLIGIVTLVAWLSGPPAPGRVAFVYELLTENVTVVSAPGASGPYGLLACGEDIPAGRPRLTVPDCGEVDQLWTTTGTSFVSPAPILSTAADRPSRDACGAVSRSHSSYSWNLPQRWKRPSAGETTRTTSSV